MQGLSDLIKVTPKKWDHQEYIQYVCLHKSEQHKKPHIVTKSTAPELS